MTARHEFSKRQRAIIFDRANGCCETCGRKVGGKVAYAVDHIVPAYAGGRATLENGQILCQEPCHRIKTQRDNREAKKSNRIRGLTGQRKRREARGGSSIKGRGFPSKKERDEIAAIRAKRLESFALPDGLDPIDGLPVELPFAKPKKRAA